MKPNSDRRQFLRLTVGALLVVPAGRFLVACGDGYDPGPGGDDRPPAAPPRADGDDIVYTSSVDFGHAHTFALAVGALEGPPGAGVLDATSDAGGHTHVVQIPMADLVAVAAGDTVRVTSSDSVGHSHVFTLIKI